MNTKKQRLFKGLALFSSIVMMSAALGGCGQEESNGKIAVIGQSKTIQFWEDVERGAKDAGEEMGYEIIYNNAENGSDIQGQIDLVNQAINDKVDAIVIAPNSQTDLNSIMQQADREGIPIIVIDADTTYSKKKTYIGTNNTSAGSVAGRQAMELLEGRGNIVAVGPSETSITSQERITGFENEIKKMIAQQEADAAEQRSVVAANVKYNAEIVEKLYCGNSRETAKEQVLAILKERNDIAMFYGTNEASTLGICDAVEEAGKVGTVKVVGFNANDDEIKYIIKNVCDALIVQSPYNMGYLGVRYASKVINDELISTNVDTGVVIVTPANLNTKNVKLLLYPYDPDGGKIDNIRMGLRQENNPDKADAEGGNE